MFGSMIKDRFDDQFNLIKFKEKQNKTNEENLYSVKKKKRGKSKLSFFESNKNFLTACARHRKLMRKKERKKASTHPAIKKKRKSSGQTKAPIAK